MKHNLVLRTLCTYIRDIAETLEQKDQSISLKSRDCFCDRRFQRHDDTDKLFVEFIRKAILDALHKEGYSVNADLAIAKEITDENQYI